CVISLGKNLFYNSIMESCLLITNNNKDKKKINKVLFIDARKELKREKTISYLKPSHITKIYKAYNEFKNIEEFSYVADIEEIIKKEASLNVPLYVKNNGNEKIIEPLDAYKQWTDSSINLSQSIKRVFNKLD
ncbi:N-6 DNA methylase, partial [Candidatus Pelagibacter sp.]|nr:N-6 DNA methylase [Candidatus Pelagibacter sp.]